jgi:hypothetical protein
MIDLPENPEGYEMSPAAAAVRDALMRDLATVDTFAEALGKSRRSIQNYLAAGCPHIRIGKTPFLVVSEARQWLLKTRRE